ncbi:MAG: type transport system ATP-binding protein, partial [Bacteroidota bacterium]|nr:type transport system ATP-binding protein [Bacteroidota bacterium]
VNTELLKKIILDLKDSGKTIILSTHVMEQAEQLCDDICLIDKGKIMLDGKIRDIKKSYGRDTIIMEFVGDDSFLNNFTGLNIINRTRNRVEFRLNNSVANMKDIIKEAIERVDIYKLEFVEPSLHEIFIDVVTKIGNSNISRNPEDNYANN